MNEKRERLQKALADARAICAKCEDEKRDFTAEERTQVDALMKEAEKLRAEIKQFEGDAAMVAKIKELGEGVQTAEQTRPQTGNTTQHGKGQTVGERFINSPIYQNWFKAIAPNGSFPDSLKGFNLPPVMYGGLQDLMGRKDLVTGTSVTSGGAFVNTDVSGIYEPLGRIPLNILGLISRGTTTSDLIEFVRQTTHTQQAAPVPEANVATYTGATGQVSGIKPMSDMSFEIVHAPVKNIAVGAAATRRALSDASQIRAIIDQDLRDDLQEELEDQVINGSGVGENFTGILHTANVLAQPYVTSVFATTRKAITLLQVTGKAQPTAWVFNPVDWEGIELTQDGTNRFYYAGPFAQGPRTLWGLPVATSQTLGAGTAILGDWRKARLWDREQTSIYVTDSHADFFFRNIIAILAELRSAFGVLRPAAFATVTLDSGT